jgi:predicted nucleotidyltransferase
MFTLFLHDNTPAAPGESHGEDGPTHAGTVRSADEHVYQLEMRVQEIGGDYPDIVRIRCPELNREWKRGANGHLLPTA